MVYQPVPSTSSELVDNRLLTQAGKQTSQKSASTSKSQDLTRLGWILTHTGFKRALFIRTKHNMQIFGANPIIKLQNNT